MLTWRKKNFTQQRFGKFGYWYLFNYNVFLGNYVYEERYTAFVQIEGP